MNRKLLVLALASATLALGACGDDDETASDTEATQPQTTEAPPTATDAAPESGGGATELKADADPGGDLAFTTETLEAGAGKVTITMGNPSPVPHAVGIKGGGVDEEGDTVEKGGTSTVTVDLKPGEYQFYCPVPGHEEGGMKGTLTVK